MELNNSMNLKDFHGSSDFALVIGNGPSARLLDYKSDWIAKIPTVGMNSAFRYWDKVGFRPTFYISMDEVVVRSNSKDIVRLINEILLKNFFYVTVC